MDSSQIYVIIAIIILAVIFALFFFVVKSKKHKQLTPLTGLAFGFIVAGIVFGNDRLVCYSLFGVGILLAVIDMIIKLRKK